MIEQARQESKVTQKEFKTHKDQCDRDLKQARDKLAKTQQLLFEKTAQYNASFALAGTLKVEAKELRAQNLKLQNKLMSQKNNTKSKKSSKKTKILTD